MIRVAYDITTLSREFSSGGRKHGILRVTEQTLVELAGHSELALSLVGMCEHEFAFGALNARCLHEQAWPFPDLQFLDTVKSRIFGDGIYRHLLAEYYKGASKDANSKDFSWWLLKAMFRILRRFDSYATFPTEQFDLFHSPQHAMPPAEVIGSLPRVVTVYDMIAILGSSLVDPSYTEYFGRFLEQIDHKRDWVICISEHARDEFCNYTGMSRERTFVTPLAAAESFKQVTDHEAIARACRLYGIPEQPYLLTVTSYSDPRKNLAHTIDCFCSMLSASPSCEANLVLVGRTSQQAAARLLANVDRRWAGRIIFSGYVADEDLSAIYSGAAAFVFPTLYEGFGLTVLEAMKCGTPVISSKTTSIPEVVGTSGLLIDPTDADELCAAMDTVLRDRPLRDRLRREGVERAQLFSWSKTADLTAKVYAVAATEKTR